MSLEKYNKKRDFAKTPEPSGRERPEGDRRIYVIQKHAASRLHYDFRIEMDGVLKSWAVPKGPSLDPADKRLAVHVEDHPLDYADFEGTIPDEEYGGGTVIVWDTGTWKPAGDPRPAYEKGRLEFALDGKKLQGKWALVQMKNDRDGTGKNWLLIKKKDRHLDRDLGGDIVAEKPESVLSGLTLEEVRQKHQSGK